MKNTRDFVSIDFETLQAVADDGKMYNKLPIQIGMVKYKDGLEIDRYSSYINPPVEGEWSSYWTIGISSSDCQGAPSYADIHQHLIDFIGELPLVAFNSSSEWYALKDACAYYGLQLPFERSRFIDPYTQCLSGYKYPYPRPSEQSGLAHWMECLGLWQDKWMEHCGVDDAEMVAVLYLYMQQADIESLLERKEPNAGWFRCKDEQKDMSLYGEPVPEEDVLHPENPLNRKYVCLTGFDREIENKLNLKLKFLGAGRLDKDGNAMNILIPSDRYMQKYGNPPSGKVSKALKNKKQVMSVSELKDILITYDLYDGELE